MSINRFGTNQQAGAKIIEFLCLLRCRVGRRCHSFSDWVFHAIFFPVALIAASVQATSAASIEEAAVIRCTLDARRDISHIGMDRSLMADKTAHSRYFDWMMQETPSQPRSPIVLFWLPKTQDSAPVLRVQHNGQDRTLAKILSRTKSNLTATVELSDRSISRAWLVTVNFRREITMVTEIQSNTGGMRGALFGFNCLFDTSTKIEPGLLGNRFEHLDK